MISPPIEQSLVGYELFYGTFRQAAVHLPGFSFQSHASTGLSDVHISSQEMERANFWRIILAPPIDVAVITMRQGLVGELISKAKQARDLHLGLLTGYGIAVELDKLFEISDQERAQAEHQGRPPRTKLASLIAEHDITSESIGEYLAALARSSHPNWLDSLQELERMRQTVLQSLEKYGDFDDPNLLQMLQDLRSACHHLDSVSPEHLILETNGDYSKAARIIEAAKKLSECVAKFGAINSFAQLAIRDRYCKVSFDPSQDDGYDGAWNILRTKQGHKNNWEGDVTEPQVPCSSPSAMRHIVLCGTNMAGKTFSLQRDLMLRLSGQSFGFAPAKSANIHQADSFVWVERTSPCEPRVLIDGEEKMPSDFCREVMARIEAYGHIGRRCIWYADESWTTTAPKYEFLLNIAEDRYLDSLNVRRYSVTHNGAVVAFWERQDKTSVHHFEVQNSDGQKPVATRKLVPGMDQSRAFEVARALGLDANFLKRGEDYCRGKYSVQEAPITEGALPRFEPAERARLKLLSQSLRSLIPQSDELVLDDGVHGPWSQRAISVRWRSQVEGLADSDDRFKPLPDGHRQFESLPHFPFIFVSSNNDHFPFTDSGFKINKEPQFRASGFVSGLLYHGATSDSRELHERQQLFTELARPGVLEVLRAQLTHLRETFRRIGSIGHIQVGDFPATLLKAFKMSVDSLRRHGSGPSPRQDSESLEVVRLAFTLIKDHCTSSHDLSGVDRHLSALSQIIALEEQRGKIQEAIQLFDTLRDEEKERVVEDSLRIDAALKELGGIRICDYLPVLYDHFNEALAQFTGKKALLELPSEAIVAFTEKVRPYLESEHGAIWSYPLRLVCAIASYAADPRKPAGDFLTTLRSVDSVHLNQYANFMEPILAAFLDPRADGQAIIEDFAAASVDADGNVTIKGDSVPTAALQPGNTIALGEELDRFESLLAVAQAIRDNGFAQAEFHTGREISISGGWNILAARDKQIAHKRIFPPRQQVEFSTGANMSGKSFDQVGLTWSLVFAQATGWVPGTAARIPIFDRIIHIERVKERTDLNLSAFGTEVKYWKQIISMMRQGGLTYLAADEPFSSTASHYRNAFNFAVAALIAESNAVGVVATHCQPPVEHFIQSNPDRALATHFKTFFDRDGVLRFTYKKESGIADSNALEVARALGFPAAILDITRGLPSMAEFEDVLDNGLVE